MAMNIPGLAAYPDFMAFGLSIVITSNLFAFSESKQNRPSLILNLVDVCSVSHRWRQGHVIPEHDRYHPQSHRHRVHHHLRHSQEQLPLLVNHTERKY